MIQHVRYLPITAVSYFCIVFSYAFAENSLSLPRYTWCIRFWCRGTISLSFSQLEASLRLSQHPYSPAHPAPAHSEEKASSRAYLLPFDLAKSLSRALPELSAFHSERQGSNFVRITIWRCLIQNRLLCNISLVNLIYSDHGNCIFHYLYIALNSRFCISL